MLYEVITRNGARFRGRRVLVVGFDHEVLLLQDLVRVEVRDDPVLRPLEVAAREPDPLVVGVRDNEEAAISYNFV